MEKISETWSSNGLISTFMVLFEGDHPLCLNQGTVYSDVCGFGWRFGIEAEYSNIRISFDPNLLQHANLGTLEVTVISKSNSGIVANEPHKIRHSLSGYDGYHRSQPSIVDYAIDNIARCPLLEFTLTFPTNLSLPAPLSVQTKRLLNNSLLGDESTDTKFYLFSRRMPGRKAGHPLPLFTSSSILRGQSSYLDTLLFDDGFRESTYVDLSTAVIPESVDDEYDYESDSDLESISLGDSDVSESLAADSDIEHTPSLPGSPPAGDIPYYSTPDSPASINPGPTGWPTAEDDPSLTIDGSSSDQSSDQSGHHPRMGRMIFRKHTAFATWKAFLFYLHTKDIKFTTLKSRRALLSPEAPVIDARSQTPSCSAKSMYRLADELDVKDLKELAFKAIESGITEDNVVQELFSGFTSRYPPIRVMEIQALGRCYNKPGVVEELKRMVPLLLVGSHTHTLEVVTSLFSRLNPDQLSSISSELD